MGLFRHHHCLREVFLWSVNWLVLGASPWPPCALFDSSLVVVLSVASSRCGLWRFLAWLYLVVIWYNFLGGRQRRISVCFVPYLAFGPRRISRSWPPPPSAARRRGPALLRFLYLGASRRRTWSEVAMLNETGAGTQNPMPQSTPPRAPLPEALASWTGEGNRTPGAGRGG